MNRQPPRSTRTDPPFPSTTPFRADTEWQNLYKAYETLPQPLKERVEGINAIHQFDQSRNLRMPPVDTKLRDRLSDAVKSRTPDAVHKSEEHTSELQSLMRISYAVFCLKKKTTPSKNKKTPHK